MDMFKIMEMQNHNKKGSSGNMINLTLNSVDMEKLLFSVTKDLRMAIMEQDLSDDFNLYTGDINLRPLETHINIIEMLKQIHKDSSSAEFVTKGEALTKDIVTEKLLFSRRTKQMGVVLDATLDSLRAGEPSKVILAYKEFAKNLVSKIEKYKIDGTKPSSQFAVQGNSVYSIYCEEFTGHQHLIWLIPMIKISHNEIYYVANDGQLIKANLSYARN